MGLRVLLIDDHNMQNQWSYDTLLLNRVDVSVPNSVIEKNQYSIKISGIKDCVGNKMKEHTDPIIVRLPEKASIGDVVINEVLFNPRPGGIDWIEIYNLSEKLINFKNWYLINDKIQQDLEYDSM